MQEANNAIFQMRFPHKLWYMLHIQTDAILWGGTGRSILLNYRVLQAYLQCDNSIFKTTNISSFIRQLNLYGFRKVTSHLQDPLCNSRNPYMHEFIHDNFQYGRPELLNNITRKALTMKKNFKPKIYMDQIIYISPLQKARLAFHTALKKAAQDLFILNSSKSHSKSGYDDVYDDYGIDEENVELEWLTTRNTTENNNTSKELPPPVITSIDNVKAENTKNDRHGEIPQDGLVDFSNEACQQNNNFPTQILSMPDLDKEPTDDTSGVELLTEFNIGCNTNEGIATKAINDKSECNSLNCVLPSVSNENIEDVSMLEKNNEDNNLYNSEWDQMFNDMISNKSSSQGISNFRELYSQISQTIDLLNS